MMDKERESNNKDIYIFIAEVSKKAMLHWITIETNNNQEIISAVKQFINDNIYLNIKQWEDLTQKGAIIGMYKNVDIPKDYQRLKELKYPIIIEILSNAPTHIINKIIFFDCSMPLYYQLGMSHMHLYAILYHFLI